MWPWCEVVCGLVAVARLTLYRFGFGWLVVGSWLCSLSVLASFVGLLLQISCVGFAGCCLNVW